MDPRPSSNRLVMNTADSHQAWLWFTHVYSLICVIAAGSMRAWRKRRKAAYSDAILLLAHLLYLAYWVLILYATISSLGMSQQLATGSQIQRASKLVFASRILLVAITSSAKLSIILLMEEVFTKDMMGWWAPLLNALAMGQALLGSLVISIGCSPKNTLLGRDNNECPGSTVRWGLFTIAEAIFECILVIPVVLLMLRIQTSLEVKIWAVLVFAARIVILIPAGLHLASYIYFERYGRPSIDAVSTIITEQIWVALVLISASLPIIMRITKKFTTSGLVLIAEKSSSSPSRSRSKGSQRTRRTRDMSRTSEEDDLYGGGIILRCDEHGVNTSQAKGGRQKRYTITSGDKTSSIESKSERHDGIMRKDGFNVSWESRSR